MDRDTALDTYRYLRGGIPVMMVLLAAALIIERAGATCWQTSISAYYFTSAHGVFIAALCAIGTMLIVYKGSRDTEDVLLNLAGILAFVVAVVPTSRPVLLCGSADLNVGGQIGAVRTSGPSSSRWSSRVPRRGGCTGAPGPAHPQHPRRGRRVGAARVARGRPGHTGRAFPEWFSRTPTAWRRCHVRLDHPDGGHHRVPGRQPGPGQVPAPQTYQLSISGSR